MGIATLAANGEMGGKSQTLVVLEE